MDVATIRDNFIRILQGLVRLLTGRTWEPQPPVVQEPAPTQPTVSLDDAKKLINPMSRPLAEIANTISSNLASMNQCLDILKKANNDEDRLKACLERDVEVLKTTKLNHPRTVCTANSCISNVGSAIEYTAICHDNCGLTGVPHDTIGHPELKNCACMNGTEYCKVGNCRCSWQLHQHITYSSRREVIKVKDEAVQKQLDEKKSVKAIMQSTLTQLAKEIQELTDEKNKIGTASAQLTVFQKEHAPDGSFIDMIDQFLESMIEQRRHIKQMETCKELEKLRKEYQEEVRLLEKALQQAREAKELLEKKKSEPPKSIWGRLADLNPLPHLAKLNPFAKAEPAPPQPFSRQPPPPPQSLLGKLWSLVTKLNPFSTTKTAPDPAPQPLKLEDVLTLLSELEKLPRMGKSLSEQLTAQK